MPLSASQHFVILSTVNLFPQARHSRTIIHLGRVIVEESKKEKKFLERQILPGTPNTKSIVAQNLPFLGFKGQATSKLKLLLGLNEVAFRAELPVYSCKFTVTSLGTLSSPGPGGDPACLGEIRRGKFRVGYQHRQLRCFQIS